MQVRMINSAMIAPDATEIWAETARARRCAGACGSHRKARHNSEVGLEPFCCNDSHNNEEKEFFMSEGMEAIIYPVTDLAQAKTLYSTLLGVDPSLDEPCYLGFRGEGLDVGLDPHGHGHGMTGPVAYWEVDDIVKSLGAGAEALQDVRDVGGGKLIASVKDADGNIMGLMQSS